MCMQTFLPVPCGPGSKYNFTGDRCELCGVGMYQPEEAQLYCRTCPAGTTSLDKGSVSRTQCLGMSIFFYFFFKMVRTSVLKPVSI